MACPTSGSAPHGPSASPPRPGMGPQQPPRRCEGCLELPCSDPCNALRRSGLSSPFLKDPGLLTK